MDSKEFVTQLHAGIFRIRGFSGTSHAYALEGIYLYERAD
jgi:hypothetical protein